MLLKLFLNVNPCRYFEERGFEMMVSQSFSKNFGLYNERAGNLVFLVNDASTIESVKSQASLIIRAGYSNPVCECDPVRPISSGISFQTETIFTFT